MKACGSRFPIAMLILRVASLVVGTLLWLALSPSTPASEDQDDGIIARSGIPGGPPPDLVVMFTGEVMGWTEPCG